MLRRILGYAALGVLVLLALKVAFALLGTLLGLTVFVLVLAAMGFVMYLMLRVFSPTTAARVHDLMGGGPQKTA